jgi:trk system potassium uptake protein
VTQLVIVALAATVTVVGFGQSALRPAQLVCLGLHVSTLALVAPYLLLLFRRGARAAVLVPIPAVAALALWSQPGAAFLLLCAAQLLVLATVWARDATTGDLLEAFYAHPALAIMLTFSLQIAIGTLLLSFPAASADGHGVAAIDAFFTSTSATCVTGLIVLDTPVAFSTFGHVVILLLIQIGGLNIMVLSTFAAVALGRGLGLRGEAALGQVLDLGQHRQAYEITRFIVVATFVLEVIGAALLAGAYLARGEGPLRAAWLGLFHSISAFCNAGFSLHQDNLVSFQRNPFVLAVVALLVTLGGLGFTVLAAGWDRLRGRRDGPAPLQVKVVLVTSAALTFGVAAWYLVAEWGHSLAGLEPVHKVTNALFHSVSLRTAGFNSVDLATCARASIPILCLVMFIGASPGSTGGGIKTTTFATVLGTLVSAVRGGAPIILGGRTVPPSLAYRGAAVIVAAAGLALAGLYLLALTQRSSFEWLLFEVFSALGTVGLSLGATFQLDGTGKLIVALLMFAGRIGPLTLFLLLSRPVEGRLGYPEAKLMIG